MTAIIIIRHSISQPIPGESAHTWQLTDEGRERCKLLAEQLQDYHIRQVYSSAEPKAVQTAGELASALNLPMAIEEDLQETRRDTAPYYDATHEFQRAIQEAMQNPDEVIFGEESFADAVTRFTDAVQRLMDAHPDETLALVTHGTVMSLFIGQQSPLQAYETWRFLQMPAYAVFSVPELELLVLKTALDD